MSSPKPDEHVEDETHHPESNDRARSTSPIFHLPSPSTLQLLARRRSRRSFKLSEVIIPPDDSDSDGARDRSSSPPPDPISPATKSSHSGGPSKNKNEGEGDGVEDNAGESEVDELLTDDDPVDDMRITYSVTLDTAAKLQPWKCHICGRVIARGQDANRHLETHEPVFDPKWSCSKCGKRLSRSDALKRHEKICTGKPSKTRKRRTSKWVAKAK